MTVQYVREELDAGGLLQRALLAYRSAAGRSVPMVVALQGSGGAGHLQSIIPALDSFPLVELPTHMEDSRYTPVFCSSMF